MTVKLALSCHITDPIRAADLPPQTAINKWLTHSHAVVWHHCCNRIGQFRRMWGLTRVYRKRWWWGGGGGWSEEDVQMYCRGSGSEGRVIDGDTPLSISKCQYGHPQGRVLLIDAPERQRAAGAWRRPSISSLAPVSLSPSVSIPLSSPLAHHPSPSVPAHLSFAFTYIHLSSPSAIYASTQFRCKEITQTQSQTYT